MADEPAQASTDRQLLLQKIYVKDLSFESPKAPEIFNTNTQANTQLNIATKNQRLNEDHFEVSLTLTIESKDNTETLFLIEIIQAGIFTLKGYSDQELQMLLGSFCPGTLYPFAREAVADIASRGGFPQLLLQPINFDAVYAQALQQRQAGFQAEVAPVQAPGQVPGQAAGQAPDPTPDVAPSAADTPPNDAGSQGGGEPH